MSSRIDPTWKVLFSVTSNEGDRCVDVFIRPAGTFGYEEFRRDPEDMGAWTALHYFSLRAFTSESETLASARASVRWLALASDT